MRKILVIIFCLFLLTGCSKINYEDSINVLNWSSYIPDSVIRDFEDKYNIRVNYGTYSSNEELLAKVSNVKKGTYDLVFPSDYMVEVMIKKGLIQSIDKSRLSNYYKIDSKYLNLDYDINNEYSIPFLASGVVIVVNRDMVSEVIDGYDDLLNSEYDNSIVLIDDTRIIVGSALMALGYDMNSTDENELDDARKWLVKLKPNIKAFDSDSPKSFLISKEASIGLMWSAEALLAKKEISNLEIIIPKEGYPISIDNFVIMKDSDNIDNVYLFIDYILSTEVMEEIVIEYPYSSVNVEANFNVGYSNIYGNDYKVIEDFANDGVRVRNIGKYISLYDKVWAYIK